MQFHLFSSSVLEKLKKIIISQLPKKNQFVKELDKKTELRSYDAYEDGEDWCIDCIAHINAKSIKDTEKIMENVFGKLDYTFDYHYIKGIDNSDYWQP